ncbi:MAG: DivIVA domain-containing protein [Bacilli bacterium]|nr:DivIVA domain-containing protein [Bacilli bacterium]
MYQERIVLSPKDILEKEFKIDTRGYRPQEVDKFLDTIISDYEEMFSLMREYERDKKDLIDENMRLKGEIRSMRTKLEVLRDNPSGDINNVDLLRRLSNLEKIVYGDK